MNSLEDVERDFRKLAIDMSSDGDDTAELAAQLLTLFDQRNELGGDPRDAFYNMSRADALLNLEDYDGAIEACDRQLEDAEALAEATEGVHEVILRTQMEALMMSPRGDEGWSSAQQWYDKAMDSGTELANSDYKIMGACYVDSSVGKEQYARLKLGLEFAEDSGHFDEARSVADQLAACMPEVLLAEVAALYWRADALDEAIATQKRCLGRYPSWQEAAERLSLLEQDKVERAEAETKSSRCFVATAAFGADDPTVAKLRLYRDERLLDTASGRVAVRVYYALSPPLARWIATSEFRKKVVRDWLIKPIADRVGNGKARP